MDMRPLFKVVLAPSAPMKEERLSTAGSRRITRASSCCFDAMAVNEIVSAACEIPWMTPVSCTGKKPLGMAMYK